MLRGDQPSEIAISKILEDSRWVTWKYWPDTGRFETAKNR